MGLYAMYQHPFMFGFSLALIGLWTLVWKGLGLWYAGKHQQKGWFIAILLLNPVGLLSIIYLLWFRPRTRRNAESMVLKRSVRRKAKK